MPKSKAKKKANRQGKSSKSAKRELSKLVTNKIERDRINVILQQFEAWLLRRSLGERIKYAWRIVWKIPLLAGKPKKSDLISHKKLTQKQIAKGLKQTNETLH